MHLDCNGPITNYQQHKILPRLMVSFSYFTNRLPTAKVSQLILYMYENLIS